MTLETMYPPQANSPTTTLASLITDIATSITVVDSSVLPAAPNLLTLGAETENPETVLVTDITGNVLTVTRAQDGTTAQAWAAGTTIGRYFTAADQTAIQTNITLLNEGKANVSHIHSGYAQIKVFSSVEVASAAWSSDATYAAFPYSATITASGVTSDMVPEVNFGLTEAASGNFAPVALSGSGTIKIYAAVAPSATITIPSITCVKAVS